MDLSAIAGLSAVKGKSGLSSISGLEAMTRKSTGEAEGTLFESVLNTAIDNIKTTNSYLSDPEDEEIRIALGETENTHDLTIALQKASTALQYTVAVRDKLLEAYKEIMQIQI